MNDDQIKMSAYELMNKLLGELDGDSHKALFVACGMVKVVQDHWEVKLNSILETMGILVQHPKLKKRGRPIEYTYIKNSIGRVPILKSQIRKAKKSRIGAPQRVNLRGMPTKIMANKIAYHYKTYAPKTYREAARQVLTQLNITYDDKLIKRLGEQAGMIAENRR